MGTARRHDVVGQPAPFAFSELTPTLFLERSALVHANTVAVIDGARRHTYQDFWLRSTRLAAGLKGLGVGPHDAVAVLASNSSLALESHHAVPLAGGVLVALNIRLSLAELRWIVQHCRARVLLCTDELADMARRVGQTVGIEVLDESACEALMASGEGIRQACPDERGLLAINYTSGTTGDPKGAMYHHRGAYLQALAMVLHTRIRAGDRYLWTLPMFHCNGWMFPWAVTAAGATHVCLRAFDPERMWRHLREDGITHFSAAPTVLTILATSSAASPLDRRVHVQTGGAPPSGALIERLDDLGFDVVHLYGLTETFGPLALNDWLMPDGVVSPAERAALTARQGVGNVIADRVRVVGESGADVPADGRSIGEIVVRGNDVMLGYFDAPDRTRDATLTRGDGAYFRTGDLAVTHPDGFLEIRDRLKDVIISGGENISSVEVENAIAHHPDIVESAVVARAHEKWGEVPVAFVAVREGAQIDPAEMVSFLRSRLAGFKIPREYICGPLPKTPTGKIRKNVLRTLLAERSEPPS